MKKIISIVLAGIMMFALVACGTTESIIGNETEIDLFQDDTTTVTLVGKENQSDVEFIMEADGDKVTKITQVMTTDVSAYDEIAVQEQVAQMKLKYDLVPGASYDGGISGGILTETIVMDVSEQDTIKGLSQQGLMSIDGNASYVSLEQTISRMEAQGYIKQ